MDHLTPVTLNNKALVPRDPAAVAAAESVRAMVQARFVMALQKPRDDMDARDQILRACKRPDFAEKVEYKKKQGSKYDPVTRAWVPNYVTGPTIRLIEVALRAWGNCHSDTKVVYDDENVRRISIMVMDLETNAAHNKEITVTKTVERKKPGDREVLAERTTTEPDGQGGFKKVYILRATDEEVENKANGMISKAIRNEGRRLLPEDFIEEALETARQTLADRDKADPDGAKKKILDSFSDLGIRPSELVKFLGHPTDTITPKELETLRGVYRAIKDGEATWQEYVSPQEPEEGAGGAGAGSGQPSAADQETLKQFDEKVASSPFNDSGKNLMGKYIAESAAALGQTEIQVKAEILKDWPDFCAKFNSWLLKNPSATAKKDEKKEPEPETKKEDPSKEKQTRGPRGPYKKKGQEDPPSSPEPPAGETTKTDPPPGDLFKGQPGETAGMAQGGGTSKDPMAESFLKSPGEEGKPGQEPPRAITDETLAELRKMCQNQNIDEKMFCHDAQVSSLEELTEDYAQESIKFYKKTA